VIEVRSFLTIIISVFLFGCTDTGLEFVPPTDGPPSTPVDSTDYDLSVDLFPLQVGNFWVYESIVEGRQPGWSPPPLVDQTTEVFVATVTEATDIIDENGCTISRHYSIEETQVGTILRWGVIAQDDGSIVTELVATVEVNEYNFLEIIETEFSLKVAEGDRRPQSILEPVLGDSLVRWSELPFDFARVRWGGDGSAVLRAGTGVTEILLSPHALGTIWRGSRKLVEYKVDSTPKDRIRNCN
jgi:hypothetical protein